MLFVCTHVPKYTRPDCEITETRKFWCLSSKPAISSSTGNAPTLSSAGGPSFDKPNGVVRILRILNSGCVHSGNCTITSAAFLGGKDELTTKQSTKSFDDIRLCKMLSAGRSTFCTSIFICIPLSPNDALT